MKLKVQLSFDKSFNDALKGAYEQWKTNIFASDLLSELRNPKQFEQAAKFVTPDEMKRVVHISSEPEDHIEWLNDYLKLGFTELILHNVNKNQEVFLQVFGEKVLPLIKKR